MVTIERVSQEPYKVEYRLHDLCLCANTEKKMPKSMINEEGNGITKEFFDYALPLIQGENTPLFLNGIQQFSKIRK